MNVHALIATAAAVVLLAAGCGDDTTSSTSSTPATPETTTETTETPEPTTETTETAPPTAQSVPDVAVAGIDSDQPCTATSQGGELPETGIALHEVAAMTIDLRQELDLADEEWMYESMFVDNGWFGSLWPAGCALATDLGRLTGHQQSVTNYSVMQESVGTPQILSVAHLFETEVGAEQYMAWVARGEDPWPCPLCNGMTAESATVTGVSTEALPEAGDGASIVRITSEQSDREIALVRKGTIVGEVQVIGPPDGLPEVDVVALGQRAWAQIDSVVPSAEPLDVVAMMSAPLPLAAWGPDYSDMEWDTTYGGGRDNWEFAQYSPDPEAAAADSQQFGRLAGYQGNYGSYGAEPMWIATGLTTYVDEAGAQGAFEDIVADRLEGSADSEPAEQFEVPGVDGAVGFVRLVQSELVTEAFLRDGSVVGRVYIIHGEVAGSEVADDRAEVVRITQTWLPRLEQALHPDG